MRIAFIGGNGHHYLRQAASQRPDDFDLALAGDGYDNDAARQRLAGIEGAAWYDDPRVMLDEFKPDVVNIGAVYGYNGDIVAEALQRDIAVVSDKPIAATWAQLDRLRSLTAKHAVPLLTEFPFRAQPEFRAAEVVVRQGEIGEVVLATAQKSYRFGTRPKWYGDRRSYGGTVLWVASHGIDVIRFATGRRFERVAGQSGNLSKPQYGRMADHTVNLFRLDNGGSAVVHADYLRPAAAKTHGDDRLRIVGSRGQIEVRDERCWLITDDHEAQDVTDRGACDPPPQQLLAAATGAASDAYSTQASLEMAAVLLLAQQAADERRELEIPHT